MVYGLTQRNNLSAPKTKKDLSKLNATQAAIRAGYSEKTVNQQGPRLLVNVGIQDRIQELMEKRSVRTEITQDMVVKELAKAGFSNMRNYALLL